MKTSKLLRKTEDILGAKKAKQRKEVECLKELLAALKKKKRKLTAKLEQVDKRSDRERIEQELAVIRMQRHKGLKTLKGLK